MIVRKHLLLFAILFSFVYSEVLAQAIEKPNFIFIVVDDLNDFVQPFTNDEPQISTPHFKQLADSGTIFLNAFSSAPGCAPSRTSFLSGKDLLYTNVYNNSDYQNNFRSNFNVENGNEEVFTLPEILKDSGGYFTFGINKIFHNHDSNDFDFSAKPPCEKANSWNRMAFYEPYGSQLITDSIFKQYAFDDRFEWGMLPDSMEYLLTDHGAADTAIQFIHDVAAGTINTCDRPFFLALGMSYPHSNRYVPTSYFMDYYLESIYEIPYRIPYNSPKGTFPYNGIVMPPQPEIEFNDYDALPSGGLATSVADIGEFFPNVNSYFENLTEIPQIEESFDDSETEYAIKHTVYANYLLTYLAAVEFVDAQIGRVINELYTHPEIANNTIIILVGDHGYSLGEKRHWDKWALWETDIRVPFILVDPTKAINQQVTEAVSLLDIFPTVCDLADVNYPVFSDGSKYLDGKSLVPLLNNPALSIELPTLTTFKKDSGDEICYKYFSVRDSRFHYIEYNQNNESSLGNGDCDSSVLYTERELYEIGEYRETDPHEWNNLIGNEDYEPVVNYLQQFLPDSNLYLQATYKAIIQNNAVNCFLTQSDTLHLFFDWLDSIGNATAPSPIFTYQWSNNLTPQLFYGTAIDFPMQLISDENFTGTDRVMFYLQVYDINHNLIAFDTKYFYINPDHTPSVTFNLETIRPLTTQVTDVTINGSYNSYWWDFGSGNMFYNDLPGPYTFSGPGDFRVTVYVQFGNNCIKSFQREYGPAADAQYTATQLTVIPNPADYEITVIDEEVDENTVISIFDVTGKLIKLIHPSYGPKTSIKISVSELKPGLYILNRQNSMNSQSASFIILH